MKLDPVPVIGGIVHRQLLRVLFPLVLGTALSIVLALELGSRYPWVSADIRVPLSYVVLALPFLIAYRADLTAFGYRRERSVLAAAVGLAFAAALLIAAGRLPDVGTSAFGPQVVSLLPLGVVAAIEEGIFRGVIQREIGRVIGAWPSVLATGVVFGLWHLPLRIRAGLTSEQLLSNLLLTIFIGVLLGVLMHLARNALAPAILHTALNWIDRL